MKVINILGKPHRDYRKNEAKKDIGKVRFGDQRKYKPNWDFKADLKEGNADDIVPIDIAGIIRESRFNPGAGFLDYYKEARNRGYNVSIASKPSGDVLYVDPNSWDTLSDTSRQMLENPKQGVLVMRNAPMGVPGDNEETRVLGEYLQKRLDKGDYTTSFEDALLESTTGLDLEQMSFRGSTPPKYTQGGYHAPSIEQQAELPGQIIDKNTGKPARLVSFVQGTQDLDSAKDYMGRTLGVLYGSMTVDLDQVYKDADTSFVPGARTVPKSEASKFVPLMYVAHGTVYGQPAYFPMRDNALVRRLEEANAISDTYEQLKLDD